MMHHNHALLSKVFQVDGIESVVDFSYFETKSAIYVHLIDNESIKYSIALDVILTFLNGKCIYFRQKMLLKQLIYEYSLLTGADMDKRNLLLKKYTVKLKEITGVNDSIWRDKQTVFN